jgi:hypothetical protein
MPGWRSSKTPTPSPARLRQVGRGAVDDGQVDAVVEQDFAQAGRRPGPVGGDDDAVAVGDQLRKPSSQPGAITDDRSPAGRLDHRCVR